MPAHIFLLLLSRRSPFPLHVAPYALLGPIYADLHAIDRSFVCTSLPMDEKPQNVGLGTLAELTLVPVVWTPYLMFTAFDLAESSCWGSKHILAPTILLARSHRLQLLR